MVQLGGFVEFKSKGCWQGDGEHFPRYEATYGFETGSPILTLTRFLAWRVLRIRIEATAYRCRV